MFVYIYLSIVNTELPQTLDLQVPPRAIEQDWRVVLVNLAPTLAAPPEKCSKLPPRFIEQGSKISGMHAPPPAAAAPGQGSNSLPHSGQPRWRRAMRDGNLERPAGHVDPRLWQPVVLVLLRMERVLDDVRPRPWSWSRKGRWGWRMVLVRRCLA